MVTLMSERVALIGAACRQTRACRQPDALTARPQPYWPSNEPMPRVFLNKNENDDGGSTGAAHYGNHLVASSRVMNMRGNSLSIAINQPCKSVLKRSRPHLREMSAISHLLIIIMPDMREASQRNLPL